MVIEEGAGALNGLLALEQAGRKGVPDVEHALGDLERRIDAGSAGPAMQDLGVVQQGLDTADLDQQGRKTGQVAKIRRGMRCLVLVFRHVGVAHQGEALAVDGWIVVRVGVKAIRREGHVAPRRYGKAGGRHRQDFVACRHQHCNGKAATRRIT